MQQTISRKLTKLKATIKISHVYYIKYYALIVIKLININKLFNVNNPQITKTLFYILYKIKARGLLGLSLLERNRERESRDRERDRELGEIERVTPTAVACWYVAQRERERE